MKKTNRAVQAEVRLQQLMIALIKDYNTTEFRAFDSNLYREAYGVGANYISALKDLDAVVNTYGKLKLTDRFFTLRPSTLRKRMGKIQMTCLATRQKKEQIPTAPSAPVYDIAVIKAQIRQEILQELRDSLQAQSDILAKLN